MTDAAVTDSLHNAWRYAQERGGQRLHLARMLPDGEVVLESECGRRPRRWRMTINMALANACGSCWRVWEARHR